MPTNNFEYNTKPDFTTLSSYPLRQNHSNEINKNEEAAESNISICSFFRKENVNMA